MSNNKSTEFYLPHQLDDTSISKDFHKLGQIFPFESTTLEAYWGGYWQDLKKREAIYLAYFRVRHPALMRMLTGDKYPDRKAVLWHYLENTEEAMNLNFKAIDGRNGIKTIDDKGNKMEGVEL